MIFISAVDFNEGLATQCTTRDRLVDFSSIRKYTHSRLANKAFQCLIEIRRSPPLEIAIFQVDRLITQPVESVPLGSY